VAAGTANDVDVHNSREVWVVVSVYWLDAAVRAQRAADR
jgi:hypothetical protein